MSSDMKQQPRPTQAGARATQQRGGCSNAVFDILGDNLASYMVTDAPY